MLAWFVITGSAMGQDQVVSTRKHGVHREAVVIDSEDEVWLISARHSHLAPCDLSLLHCCRLKNSQWVESEIGDLVACHSQDKSRATMIFAHGNRTDLSWAQSRGLQFYHKVFGTRPCERPPVRFVIFAWKSEAEILFPRADFKIKSQRSCELGELFSRLLDQFDDRNMLIGGYSLGGQIVLSGLSKVNCQPDGGPSTGQFLVALVAPVFHSNFCRAPLQDYSNNSLVEQTIVFWSRRDKVVKVGARIERRNDRRSGTTMDQLMNMWCWGTNGIRISNVTREVGHKHSVLNYASSPTLQCELVEMLNRVYLVSNQPVADESSEIEASLVPDLMENAADDSFEMSDSLPAE